MPADKTTAAAEARLQHASENTSDYLEVIADLIAVKGEARAVDVASHLKVTKATVNKKIGQLQREGLVRSEPYRSIFLTPPGQKIAAESKARHIAVLDFLLSAGVPHAVAEKDAEGIEHHVSPQTLNAMKKLTKLLREEKKQL